MLQSRRLCHIRGSACPGQKLEAALLAMADFPGPEVDVLQAFLTHAKIAVVPPPVNVQVIQCQQFIERTVKRIEELDKMRKTQSRRLQEGRQRLQRLQQEAVAGAPTVSDLLTALDMASEVVRLQDPGTIGNEGFRRFLSQSSLPRRQCAGESLKKSRTR